MFENQLPKVEGARLKDVSRMLSPASFRKAAIFKVFTHTLVIPATIHGGEDLRGPQTCQERLGPGL